MKIGFLAMSGIRAHDPKLLEIHRRDPVWGAPAAPIAPPRGSPEKVMQEFSRRNGRKKKEMSSHGLGAAENEKSYLVCCSGTLLPRPLVTQAS